MIPPKRALLGTTLLLLTNCTAGPEPEQDVPTETSIDQRSFALGALAAFAEMVDAGVKELALSSPREPGRMDAMIEEAQRITAEHRVELYREADFMVTDLFSSELTEGKEVLLIYRGETLQKYMALKAEKERLLSEGRYEGALRTDLARRFGRLLSYSEEKIEALLDPREGA